MTLTEIAKMLIKRAKKRSGVRLVDSMGPKGDTVGVHLIPAKPRRKT